MGEGQIVNPRLYIIPVLVLIVCNVIFGLISSAHRSTIREMVDTAGRNGEPIIVSTDFNTPKLTWFNISSFQQDPVPLFPDDLTLLSTTLFDNDGTLYFFTYNNYSSMNSATATQLPDYRSIEVQRESPPDFSRLPALVRSMFMPWSSRWAVSDLVSDGESSTLYYTDLVTGEQSIRTLTGTLPWEEEDSKLSPFILGYISLDFNALIAILGETGSADPEVFYRYDFDTSIWSFVTETELYGPMDTFVNPDASMIAIIKQPVQGSQFNTRDVYFIDGYTGEEYAMEPAAGYPVVGRRWAACTSEVTFGNYKVIMFDMENNWERREIPSINSMRINLFEPPADGIDGMFEN